MTFDFSRFCGVKIGFINKTSPQITALSIWLCDEFVGIIDDGCGCGYGFLCGTSQCHGRQQI
ncbi:hypothetical protein [Moraxella porci]|uniref:hypothetical protein n=1 Tax=Moraxella porci TaxID=1288392 RepID=UPI001B802F70|nr:hypothetical protein [Moraxella porci]